MAKRKNEWFHLLKLVAIAVTIALIIRTFFFSPIIVDGPSMLPTLQDRDQMIVNKFIYHFQDPQRFDIVVFHASAKNDFIKRVIGLPGEHVAVENGELYINEEKIEEPFLDEDSRKFQQPFRLEDLPGSHKKIPKDHVLVLGDNRNNSTDSRSFGLIETDEIVGKASFIYWPIKRIQKVK